MLHASFPPSLKQYSKNNEDEVRRFSLRNMHRRHVPPSALVPVPFSTPRSHVHHSAKERIFIFRCFHPNQTQQITKEHAKSLSYRRNREAKCVWEELFHFFFFGRRKRESRLIQPKCADRPGKD